MVRRPGHQPEHKHDRRVRPWCVGLGTNPSTSITVEAGPGVCVNLAAQGVRDPRSPENRCNLFSLHFVSSITSLETRLFARASTISIPRPHERSMRRTGYLGEFEQLVLLATLRLRGRAYGPSIAAELEERAGRRVSRGALYGTLDRLEGKEFLSWIVDSGSEERSGQPLRLFRVTESGLEALRSSRAAVRNLEAGLEDLLSEG